MLTGEGSDWSVEVQWQGQVDGVDSVSVPFTLAFALEQDRVSVLRAARADFAFVLGDSILPQVAFALLIGQLQPVAA